MVATDGTIEALDRLYALTRAGFQDSVRYGHAQGLNPDGTPNPAYERMLDVNNLIDFMIIEYYTGDRDGPGSRFGNIPNNTVGLYNRVTPDGFKWVHHDNEHSLGTSSSEENMVTPFTTAGATHDYFNPHWLHEQLMLSQPDYRMAFADRVYRHFFNDGCLTVEDARQGILGRASQIDLAIIAESARWGDARKGPAERPFTKDDSWWPEIQRIVYGAGNSYLTNRVSVVLSQLRAVGWYPKINPPVLSRYGGRVSKGFPLTLTSPQGTAYYTLDGVDPRVPAARSGPGKALTLVPESASKRVLIPKSWDPANRRGHDPGRVLVQRHGPYDCGSDVQSGVPGQSQSARAVAGLRNPGQPVGSIRHPRPRLPVCARDRPLHALDCQQRSEPIVAEHRRQSGQQGLDRRRPGFHLAQGVDPLPVAAIPPDPSGRRAPILHRGPP